MVVIKIENDIHEFLLRQTKSFGDSPSSVLRRFFPIPESKKPVSRKQSGDRQGGFTHQDEKKSDFHEELSELLNSISFAFANSTERYLEILGFFYRQDKNRFRKLLTVPMGRNRVYFADSKEEIATNGASTHPRPIPGSPYWALTNNSTLQKKEILRKAMRALENQQYVNDVLAGFDKPKF